MLCVGVVLVAVVGTASEVRRAVWLLDRLSINSQPLYVCVRTTIKIGDNSEVFFFPSRKQAEGASSTLTNNFFRLK